MTTLEPRRIADVVLAAAVRAQADSVYIEPIPASDDTYVVTIERGSTTIATTKLAATVGPAVIARLAFIADLDLAAPHTSSGVVPVRTGGVQADVVVTIRPGTELRADLALIGARGTRTAPSSGGGVEPGEVVGNFRIVKRLGEGGMGTVYRVEHVVLGRQYALKVLRHKVIERDPTAAGRFLREARAAARIRHANIVDVFDFGYVGDGRPFFVMELLEGESLQDRLERVGPLQPAEVVSIARQLALGLGAAHDCGVIHADVTPSNALLVSRDGEEPHAKLVDFGLAELVGESMHDEDSDFVLGTPAYISPEQLRGLPPTAASDQYGLGAVLFELLSGRPPFEDQDLRALCMKHIQAPIPPVTSPHGPLPGKLGEVITTCLQKSPQARFPGMRAMIAALDEIERVADRRGWRKWLVS
nr:serine/threonine-protein kinase [Kofleriaceae bacterium]